MAQSMPTSVIESVYGLPAGTIEKVGPEAAAELVLAIERDPDDPLVKAMLAALGDKEKL